MIEIVIKMDDKDYKRILAIPDVSKSLAPRTYSTIRNGTPLPKGHGRLVDYSWIVKNVINKLGIKDERYLLEAEKALMSIIEIAPTIIEGSESE